MNRKGQNIQIDKLLNKIEASGNYSFDWHDFAPQNEDSDNEDIDPITEYNRLIFFLLEIGIFKRIHDSMEYLVLTNLGFEVINKGGWIKYLGKKDIKQKVTLYKDIVLIIIPVLSLFATIILALNRNNKENSKAAIELIYHNRIIESKLEGIENQILEFKEIIKSDTVKIND